MFEDVFKEMPQHLIRQRAQMRAERDADRRAMRTGAPMRTGAAMRTGGDADRGGDAAPGGEH